MIVSRYATCGLPTCASTLNSRIIRSTSTSRCSSPMPAMIVWPVSSSVWTWKVGSSSESELSALPSLSWSFFVLGSIATEMTGSGNSMRSSTIGCARSHSVSPVVVCLKPRPGDDVAGVRDVDVLALVRVHAQDATDALLAVLGGVVDLRALLERARVDAEVGELAVGVGDDLERERRERLVFARLALDRSPRPSCRCPAVGGMSSGDGR